MRRISIIYLFVCSVLAIGLFANVSGAAILAATNNTTNGAQEIVIEQAVKCWVSDTPGGTAVKSVKECTYSGPEYMYWMTYNPGTTIHSLCFIVLFYGKGGWGTSPLVYQGQVFQWREGYSGGTTTPFGVPWWGGDLIIGPAVLVPQVDGEYDWSSYYIFNVVK